ncbi:MAG: DUF3244 domain-containing protein [Saprospiraceae bacterium]
MKTRFLFTIALLLGINAAHWAQTTQTTKNSDLPYVEVVVTQEKIWLMPDELPVADLHVKVLNNTGKVVLQKTYNSETEDWSLDVSSLAAGKYKILIGTNQTEYLSKQGPKGLL